MLNISSIKHGSLKPYERYTCLIFDCNLNHCQISKGTFFKDIDSIIITSDGITLNTINCISEIVNCDDIKYCSFTAKSVKPLKFFKTLFSKFNKINSLSLLIHRGINQMTFELLFRELYQLKLKYIHMSNAKRFMRKSAFEQKITNLLQKQKNTIEIIDIDDHFDVQKELIGVLMDCTNIKKINIKCSDFCRQNDTDRNLLKIMSSNKNTIEEFIIDNATRSDEPYSESDSIKSPPKQTECESIFTQCAKMHVLGVPHIDSCFGSYIKKIKQQVHQCTMKEPRDFVFNPKYFNWNIITRINRSSPVKSVLSKSIKHTIKNMIYHSNSQYIVHLVQQSTSMSRDCIKLLVESVCIEDWTTHIFPKIEPDTTVSNYFMFRLIVSLEEWLSRDPIDINRICMIINRHLIQQFDKSKPCFFNRTFHQFVSINHPSVYDHLFPHFLIHSESRKIDRFHPYKKTRPKRVTLDTDIMNHVIEWIDCREAVSKQTLISLQMVNTSMSNMIKNIKQ